MNPFCCNCLLAFWGCYCCAHIGLFSYILIDEQCDVTNKCKEACNNMCNKMKKRRGYDRVELEIEEMEPEMIPPEIGEDKILYKSYKPMRTLYEITD